MLVFSPPLERAEIQLFGVFGEERKRPNHRPHFQRRQAEQMLAIYRPQLANAYALAKEGATYTAIGAKLQVRATRAKVLHSLAIAWLNLALLDDPPEEYRRLLKCG